MMKRSFFNKMLVAALLYIAVVNLSVANTSTEMSLLNLANIEALAANDEIDDNSKLAERFVSTNQNTIEVINGVTMYCDITETSCIGKGLTSCSGAYIKACVPK